MNHVEQFTRAYIGAALWSSSGDNGESLDSRFSADDLAPETRAQFESDCLQFFHANKGAIDGAARTLGMDVDRVTQLAGHDFWLTRCGHGAGFWDGDWPAPYETQLDESAQAFGNCELYIGDDGLIYASA